MLRLQPVLFFSTQGECCGSSWYNRASLNKIISGSGTCCLRVDERSFLRFKKECVSTAECVLNSDEKATPKCTIIKRTRAPERLITLYRSLERVRKTCQIAYSRVKNATPKKGIACRPPKSVTGLKSCNIRYFAKWSA